MSNVIYKLHKYGKTVISCKYDAIESCFFDDELALVALDGKYGLIEKKGKEVVACKNDEADWFEKRDLAWIKLKGKWGFVNKKGKDVMIVNMIMLGDFQMGRHRLTLRENEKFLINQGK